MQAGRLTALLYALGPTRLILPALPVCATSQACLAFGA